MSSYTLNQPYLKYIYYFYSRKIKAKVKEILPLFTKMILSLKYLLIFNIRVGCIVTYFAPFIGLLGILDHYQAEKTPIDPDTYKNINES